MKSNANPPGSPFFKGGIVSMRFSPFFNKEGKGRFFEGMKRTNAANFRDSTLVSSITTVQERKKNHGWKTLFPAVQWLPESTLNMRVRGEWQKQDGTAIARGPAARCGTRP
jgi:hypothetical protein